MKKQEMIKLIDEKLIQHCQSIIRDITYPSEETSLYLTSLANAKLALCTKYEENEDIE